MKASFYGYMFAVALAIPSRATAQTYQFDVDYFGGGVASLVPGSDDPTSLSLFPGDSFTWTIAANANSYWYVDVGGDFFPLMAFPVNEPGTRIGNYALTLSYRGTNVFTESATDVETEEVHMGTNTITLAQGLAFDLMRLDFELTSGVELAATAADPSDLQPISSSPSDFLPVFGAPESNRFSPGISYVVPEPSALALLSVGLAVGVMRRR